MDPTPNEHGAPLQVAVVDDDETNRAVLCRLLQREGFEVRTFDSAAACLEVVRAGELELLFTDVDMPGMDGLELLQTVKQERADIEVIVMTAGVDVQLAMQATRLGALDCLEKPFTDRAAVSRVAQTAAQWVRSGGSRTDAAAAEGFQFSGQLDEVDLAQVMQAIVGIGRDGILTLAGPPAGQIWLCGGNILDAHTEGHRGEKALYRLLRRATGSYSLEKYKAPASVTLGERPETYVIEGARREDECRKLERQLDLDQPWELNPDCTVTLSNLTPLHLAVLSEVLRAPAARDVIDLPGHMDLEILTALDELRALGAVRPDWEG